MSESFANQKEKKEFIVSSLTQMQLDTGWRVIVKALEEKIKSAEARLHGDVKLEEGETMEHWQQVRNDRLQMIDLPEIIINDNKERAEFDPHLDPYE